MKWGSDRNRGETVLEGDPQGVLRVPRGDHRVRRGAHWAQLFPAFSTWPGDFGTIPEMAKNSIDETVGEL